MNPVQKWLEEMDPIGREPPLPPHDVQRMRQLVMVTAEERSPALSMPRVPGWAAATLAVVVASGLVASRWRQTPGASGPVVEPARERIAEPLESGTRRQLQFATPGGTRVIWTFNSDFKP